MIYANCKTCDVVVEGTCNWRAGDELIKHIENEHPEIIKKVADSEERYRQEIGKIKPVLAIGHFMIFEALPKKEGRIEHEGRIINI